jgi:hypothetical protein
VINLAFYFCPPFQMWSRLLIGILLAVAAYAVFMYFKTEEAYTNWDNVIETPAPGTTTRELKPRGDLNVAAGGPNSPNAAPPSNMPPTLSTTANASDPYAETAEEANAPENLRFPERSFGPGIVPEQTAIAEASGVAGPPVSSAQAFQQFSPEYVQNGGSFFGTVSALEDENPNYSAF